MNLAEMLKACDSVDFSHLFGLLDSRDNSFIERLKGARNLVILRSIAEQNEKSVPAVKCILTDHLFSKENPLSKKINVNLLIPDQKPENFQTSKNSIQIFYFWIFF